MDIKSLMIGDWVYNKHHGKNIRLTPYDFFTHTHNEFGEQELAPFVKPTIGRDLEPILLTPEILEKNGFKKFNFRGIDGQHEWTWWNNTLTNVSLWCRELNDNTKDGWMIRIESPTSSLCVKVEFLHELQHALKLCGIEKEIEL